MVNGLVQRNPVRTATGSRAQHPLWGDVGVDGHRLSQHPELASLVEQVYDLSRGEPRPRFVY